MNIKSESVDRLFQTILNLETIDDCYKYFEDLCTINEILTMSQRLSAAILLSEGRNYHEITEQMDISTATIGRVSKCLNDGNGGYADAIKKLREKEETK